MTSQYCRNSIPKTYFYLNYFPDPSQKTVFIPLNLNEIIPFPYTSSHSPNGFYHKHENLMMFVWG